MRNEPPAGDDLARMLVRMRESVLRETRETGANSSRRRRHRVIGVVVAVIALFGIGAGGAFALGIVPSPFRSDPVPTLAATPTPSVPAPTVTPTSTPPPAPTAAPDFSAPSPTVPATCSELGDAVDLAALMTAPKEADALLLMPEQAALRQAGVLSCVWTSDSYSILTVDIAADPESGLTDVDSALQNGETSLGTGDASAASCELVTAGCRASIVSGSYWLTFGYEGLNVHPEAGPGLLADAGRVMLGVLSAEPAPLPHWTMPPTTWSPVTDCSAFETPVPMATILGSPQIVGPATLNPGSENGIQQTQRDSYACRWSVPDDATTSSGQVPALTVQLAPGARWAFPATSGAGIEAVALNGAQDAAFECQTEEGVAQCWLNVLTDDSWLQLGYGDGFTPDQKQVLAAAAEAILTAHG
ncbi:MAG: hypothetical protein JWR01_676 [Subtercola sp.]|nr:hypothetical protein [Subtercola sp.]